MKVEFNRHDDEFRCDFTIEFEVKGPAITISDKQYQFEWETGEFTNGYAQSCTDRLDRTVRSKTWYIEDWSFAGRSNGWYVLLCRGEMERVTENQLHQIEAIVERAFRNYGKELAKHYSE